VDSGMISRGATEEGVTDKNNQNVLSADHYGRISISIFRFTCPRMAPKKRIATSSTRCGEHSVEG